MARPRIGFLPAFFTILGIAFVIALAVRIRSYSGGDGTAPRPTVSETNTAESPRSVIVTAQPDASAPATPNPSRQRARQQARDALMAPPAEARKAPVQTPPPATQPKPSLLSRIVTPIVNAISGTPATKAQQAPPERTQPQPSQSSSRQPGSSTDTSGDRPPADTSSDTLPPHLLAIAFNPPQVRDGEETLLSVQATDDLSGIRSVSGTIAAPSGATQGFACQRELESDRYIARIAIPKDAAEGVWRMNYLSLIDNASNAITLSGAQSGLANAIFRVVSSRPDSQGPTLKSVWVDRQVMRAGEKNTIFVDAEDDKSGLNLVSGVFLSPARHARIGFVCRPGTGVWQCDLSTPACIDCGEWTLEQIQMQDKANNMTTVRAENPAVAGVRLSITGDKCDSTVPTIQAITLDRGVVSNVEESVITITASASDDLCGIMSMSGQVTGPQTQGGAPRLYFSFTPADPQTWTGRITVPKLAAKGLWRVSWLQVLDQAHNLRTYSQGEGALASAVFNVQ